MSWRQGGVKQNERFGTASEAEWFKGLVEHHGNEWPPGWVKGHGFTELPSKAPTFREWAARAIASRATANERTRHDYKRDLERHVFPTFGDTPVDRITVEQVGAWLIKFAGTTPTPGSTSPTAKAVSPKTVKNVHSLASSIMADAVAAQLTGVNPFKGRMRGQAAVKQEEMVFLTRDEFEALLALVDDHYRPLVLCLAHTGLRWSEATALRVGDVDLLSKRVTVTRAWKRTPENHFVLGEPKSRRSRRTLVMSTRLALAMQPLMQDKRSTDFIFTTAQEHPVRHANFRLRTWVAAVAALEAATGKRPRIHDVRHSHASWLIADKVSLVAIQRRLGHESITTTVDRYGHLMPDIDDEISAAIDKWVGVPEPLAASPLVAHTPGS